jgi:hypothetical protein
MVSFSVNVLLDLAGPLDEPEKPKRVRPRHDWARGEVRCLMCARLLGRLLGADERRRNRGISTTTSVSFFAFRPLNPSQPVVRFAPGMRIRCGSCGGTGALDDVDFFSTYDDPPVPAEDEEPIRRGPGRPPRPFKRSEATPGGVAVALTRLGDMSAAGGLAPDDQTRA